LIERTASQQTIANCDCWYIASPAVLDIFGPKRTGVMTLTFQGHITSPYAPLRGYSDLIWATFRYLQFLYITPLTEFNLDEQ